MLAGACLVAPAEAGAAKLNARTAAAALEKKVESKYRRIVRERLVMASCKRRTAREYRCLYGVHGTFEDGVENPDSRWVYSGVGYVRKNRRTGRLSADPLPPRRGGEFAPFGRPKPYREPDLTAARAQALVRQEAASQSRKPEDSVSVACAAVGPREYDCTWVAYAAYMCQLGQEPPVRGTATVYKRAGEEPVTVVTGTQPVACDGTTPTP